MKRNRAVAIVIHDDGLLVIHRRSEGHEYYTLPGGGVEQHETIEQAIARELQEEASLDITVGRRIYEHHYDDGTSQFFYLCHYVSGIPQLASNAPERQAKRGLHQPMWLPLKLLSGTLLYPLEIRDWIMQDLVLGFPQEVRAAKLSVGQLRQTI